MRNYNSPCLCVKNVHGYDKTTKFRLCEELATKQSRCKHINQRSRRAVGNRLYGLMIKMILFIDGIVGYRVAVIAVIAVSRRGDY